MRIHMLGVGIDNVTRDQALRAVQRRIASQQPTVIYTPNPIMIHQAMQDDRFRRTLNRAALNLPDGIGLLLAARLMGLPLTERVAGIEFGQELLALAARKKLRVFLLGATPGTAEQAARNLQKQMPKLTVCGTHHGYFKQAESPEICRKIENARTDILLVCLGSPAQEIWIDTHHPKGVLVSVALGGSLDVWAGRVMRAPRLLSDLGLEWLWRMIREPHRLAKLPAILEFLLAALQAKKSGSPYSNGKPQNLRKALLCPDSINPRR